METLQIAFAEARRPPLEAIQKRPSRRSAAMSSKTTSGQQIRPSHSDLLFRNCSRPRNAAARNWPPDLIFSRNSSGESAVTLTSLPSRASALRSDGDRSVRPALPMTISSTSLVACSRFRCHGAIYKIALRNSSVLTGLFPRVRGRTFG